MKELLAPAGNFESLVAAISNGADAVYLGYKSFGARAYADNFDLEELQRAVNYAHLRKVKIYVTLNTIVFENELSEVYSLMDRFYQIGVDALIVQDLALIEYGLHHLPQMEIHCSTQMGIDDVEGALFFKRWGVHRIVLARETSWKTAKKIKEETQLSIEIFIHGALCVSYSGNCLMSGLIGSRSGNRGRCVGACRKAYRLVNQTTGTIYPKSYLLSMKDLNTLDNLSSLDFADSFKIEGRMKEATYVANVVKSYRQQIDHPDSDLSSLQQDLLKTFHRTYTKGYLLDEKPKNMVQSRQPNHCGFPIGIIEGKNSLGYRLSLTYPLAQNDIIRIRHQPRDILLPVTKIYNRKKELIRQATKECWIPVKEPLAIGDIVDKFQETSYLKELKSTYPKEFRRFPLDIVVSGQARECLELTVTCEDTMLSYSSSFRLEEAKTTPTTEEDFARSFGKLSDSVYELRRLSYLVKNGFIPVGKINELRRSVISQLNAKRILCQRHKNVEPLPFVPIVFAQQEPQLAVFATTEEQKKAAEDCQIRIIYTPAQMIERNHADYRNSSDTVLVGGYGALVACDDKTIVTDYSFNVTNAQTVSLLHRNHVHRITLSYELNFTQIQQLLASYARQNGGYPNVELIVYGRAPLMVSKYCPISHEKSCGLCRKNSFAIQDDYATFPILTHTDCSVTILNSKTLNLIDELEKIKHISVFRLQFTTENYDETYQIIRQYQHKLKTKEPTELFRSSTDTHGHFYHETL